MSKRKGDKPRAPNMDTSSTEMKSGGIDVVRDYDDDHKEGGQLKIWLAVAVAIGLAGFSYYLSGYSTHAGIPQTSVSRTSVPESYAVCGGTPGTIYTVDESHPNVDCLLIHKDEIRVAGTLGP